MGKVTAYIDEEIWNEFKKMVVENTDDNRALSKELQKLIEDSLADRIMAKTFRDIDLLPGTLPSVQSIKKVIPRVGTSAGKTVRKMRGDEP
ncbi:MAG: hypothetical protein ACRD32_05550 [Nitrososphaerales archaeon]